jgi:hypothetical protein
MALFKSLADKIQKKKDELQAKAAEIALERGKQAALEAGGRARKKIEEALFGDDEAKPPKAAKAAKEKARSAAKLEKDVDDDLAALRKRVAKGK